MNAQQLMNLMTKFQESLNRQCDEIKSILEESNRMMDEATSRIETKLDEMDKNRMRISDRQAAEDFAAGIID